MIKVILKGGLGNQIFQYAFGKSLALEKGQELVLDTSFLDCRVPVKGFTIRNYELDLFGIPEKPRKSKLPNILSKYLEYPIKKVIGKLNKDYLVEGTNVYAYDEDLVNKALNATGDVILEGYWNNYLYFDKHATEIKAIFDTEKLNDAKYNDIEEAILNSNSVSINIRRGDYLNAKHSDVFVYLDKDYYQKAIEIIRSKVQNPKFFVFSYDDPEWIKTQLEFAPEELVIIGKEFVGERFRTYLRLISLCKHNIISNSTFAFWGAYLNKNYQKTFVGPSNWQNNIFFQYPEKWIGA